MGRVRSSQTRLDTRRNPARNLPGPYREGRNLHQNAGRSPLPYLVPIRPIRRDRRLHSSRTPPYRHLTKQSRPQSALRTDGRCSIRPVGPR